VFLVNGHVVRFPNRDYNPHGAVFSIRTSLLEPSLGLQPCVATEWCSAVIPTPTPSAQGVRLACQSANLPQPAAKLQRLWLTPGIVVEAAQNILGGRGLWMLRCEGQAVAWPEQSGGAVCALLHIYPPDATTYTSREGSHPPALGCARCRGAFFWHTTRAGCQRYVSQGLRDHRRQTAHHLHQGGGPPSPRKWPFGGVMRAQLATCTAGSLYHGASGLLLPSAPHL
jgi:hypothetical protein